MALEFMTRKVRVRHVATTTLVLLDVGAALAQVHAGLHWPLDVAGAALIGAGLVVLARIVLEEPSWHRWCGSCLWQERAALAPAVAPTIIETDPPGPGPAPGDLAVGRRAGRGLPDPGDDPLLRPRVRSDGHGLEVPLQWPCSR